MGKPLKVKWEPAISGIEYNVSTTSSKEHTFAIYSFFSHSTAWPLKKGTSCRIDAVFW